MSKKLFLVTIGLILNLLVGSLCLAKDDDDDSKKGPSGALFRYKNEKGTWVTSHILPPEMAYKGYQIVTVGGDVLQTVAPAPTDEEKQKILQAIDQEKYDKALLLRYGTLADLMKAQKRKLGEIEAKLSVLTGNQSNIKSQIEAEQAKAANYERQGRPIPEAILTTLEGLWGNMEKNEDQIRVISGELKDEKARYDREILRYKQLKGLK